MPNLNRHSCLLPVSPEPFEAAQAELSAPPVRHRERRATHFLHQAGKVPQAPPTCGTHWASPQRPRKPGKRATAHLILRYLDPLVAASTRRALD